MTPSEIQAAIRASALAKQRNYKEPVVKQHKISAEEYATIKHHKDVKARRRSRPFAPCLGDDDYQFDASMSSLPAGISSSNLDVADAPTDVVRAASGEVAHGNGQMVPLDEIQQARELFRREKEELLRIIQDAKGSSSDNAAASPAPTNDKVARLERELEHVKTENHELRAQALADRNAFETQLGEMQGQMERLRIQLDALTTRFEDDKRLKKQNQIWKSAPVSPSQSIAQRSLARNGKASPHFSKKKMMIDALDGGKTTTPKSDPGWKKSTVRIPAGKDLDSLKLTSASSSSYEIGSSCHDDKDPATADDMESTADLTEAGAASPTPSWHFTRTVASPSKARAWKKKEQVIDSLEMQGSSRTAPMTDPGGMRKPAVRSAGLESLELPYGSSSSQKLPNGGGKSRNNSQQQSAVIDSLEVEGSSKVAPAPVTDPVPRKPAIRSKGLESLELPIAGKDGGGSEMPKRRQRSLKPYEIGAGLEEDLAPAVVAPTETATDAPSQRRRRSLKPYEIGADADNLIPAAAPVLTETSPAVKQEGAATPPSRANEEPNSLVSASESLRPEELASGSVGSFKPMITGSLKPYSRAKSEPSLGKKSKKASTSTSTDLAPHTAESLGKYQGRDDALKGFMSNQAAACSMYTRSDMSVKNYDGIRLVYFKKKLYIPEKLRDKSLQYYFSSHATDDPGAKLLECCIWPDVHKDIRAYSKTLKQ